MEQNIKSLLSILRSQITGTELADDVKNNLDDTTIRSIYSLSLRQDLEHIVSGVFEEKYPADRGGIFTEIHKAKLLALYRHEQMNFQYERICAVLRESKVKFIPLKGAVIRPFYPEPWMRTSCDIDILVHEDELDSAVKRLSEKLGYRVGKRNFHDISLYSDTDVHLELHFNILENIGSIDKVLSKVWDYAVPSDDGSSEYNLTPEFLIFHTAAHMSYHFAFGGCGIRPFIDLYLLLTHLRYDENKLMSLLSEAELERFYAHAKKLSFVWFENEQHDEVTPEMEQYILSGSLYGTKEGGAAAVQARSGGKFKYVLGRVFQPYNVLKEKYPIIKKHPSLTPVYEVKRWFDILLHGKMKKSIGELKTASTVSKEKSKELSDFLAKIGL